VVCNVEVLIFFADQQQLDVDLVADAADKMVISIA
jgi:hypothetical protein